MLEKPPASPTQGILDLFTVPGTFFLSVVNDPFAPGGLPPKPPTDHLADDVCLSMETGFPARKCSAVRSDVVEEMTLGDAKFDALAVGAAEGG